MSAILLDGKKLAAETQERLRAEVEVLKERGITPGLTVIYVGDDPASAVYVRNKKKTAAKIGINGNIIRMPADTTQEALHAQIDALNADTSVHGILVQHPLPAHLDEQAAFLRISPCKDCDGFHEQNAGALLLGHDNPAVSCTPKGMIQLLKAYNIPLSGKRAVMVGRSNIVGKPMAMMLLAENCTVTIAHSRTQDIGEITKQADILCVAIGRRGFITADMVKPGAVVLDVGMNKKDDGKLCGDVEFDAVSEVASYITPVPGGVGPMTIAMLMDNTVELAKRYGK